MVLHYSHDRRVPLWVQQHLSKDILKGSSHRDGVQFHSDEEVEEQWRALNSDYKGSGWSKGHMAPAADNKANINAMTESFLLSNIVPQNYSNNSNYWNRLELYCRDVAHKYTNLWVTSGPAFLPTEVDGKNIMQYEVIGSNEVAVPTHLYKVLVTEDKQGAKAMAAFLVPNEPIVPDQPLKHFQVPLESLEKIVGFTFYDKLDRGSTSDLCEVDGCEIMTDLQLRQFVYVKRIKRQKTKDALDKLWGKVKTKEFPITKEMQAAYDTRLLELPSAAAAAEGA
uniref:Nuclease EXOG n=1 Tax=Hirondellea gigas TaxID=1518452 RepID=A0A6A7FN34_9CRUS